MSADAPTWDLEVLIPGGPGGQAFATRRDALRAQMTSLGERIASLGRIADDPDGWAAVLLDLDVLDDDLVELGAYASCAAAADSRSTAARAAEAEADELHLQRRLIDVRLASALDEADDPTFTALIARPDLAPQAPMLRHHRTGRRLRLAPALQALKVETDREALTGWGRLYDQISGDLTAELAVPGAPPRRLGVAEVGAMRAEPDPAVRRAAYEASGRAWRGVSEICAHTLTQIVGARQQHNDRRGVDDLADSLHGNRVDAALLDAMWAAADAARPALVRFLRHKAKVLGKEALDWWDLDAPVGASERRWGWEQATADIASAFGAFHPELAAFADEAVRGRWVDALPREGRRPGGFCTGFPLARQSRIFMTFTGSLDNATTLAHELGHAYHNRVLEGQIASRCALTNALAETASTFAEAVFRDRVLATASDPPFRAFMLDQQLQAAVAFLMDIPHRFQLERRLYELRRQGVLSADQLSDEVVAIQRRCWGDALATWDPMFWCSKLHFYIPETSFYNWPYTFGYLFSSAVYAEAQRSGPAFLDRLKDLLVRTGWQDTAELAREVLGADLRSPAFWEGTVAAIPGWVDAFVSTTSGD